VRLDPPNDPTEEQTEPIIVPISSPLKNFERSVSRSSNKLKKQPVVPAGPLYERSTCRKFSFSEKTQTFECPVPKISLNIQDSHTNINGSTKDLQIWREGAVSSVGRAGPARLSPKMKMDIAESA
jgi:hypothetical protein